MLNRIQKFQDVLNKRQAVKIIAGIDNTNLSEVITVVKAAEKGHAAAVDICAQADVVSAVLNTRPEIAIFASSVNPDELATAVKLGADIAELGNFDALYKEGVFFSAQQVLELAKETRALLPASTLFSVTIPGHLSVESQKNLARSLEALNVNFIQTEGATQLLSKEAGVKLLSASEKEALTLHNTQMLSTVTELPLITASGLTPSTVQLAFENGASAIGIGSYIREAKTEAGMTDRVSATVMAATQASATAAMAV